MQRAGRRNVSINLTQEQRQQLNLLAAQNGTSLSGYVRAIVARHLRRPFVSVSDLRREASHYSKPRDAKGRQGQGAERSG